jgi:hypothetical protein
MKVVNMGFSLTILAISFYFWAKSEEQDDPIPTPAATKTPQSAN